MNSYFLIFLGIYAAVVLLGLAVLVILYSSLLRSVPVVDWIHKHCAKRSLVCSAVALLAAVLIGSVYLFAAFLR